MKKGEWGRKEQEDRVWRENEPEEAECCSRGMCWKRGCNELLRREMPLRKGLLCTGTKGKVLGVMSRPQLTRLLIDEGEPMCFLPLEDN